MKMVSIIVPVYNVAPFLGAAMESLCNQSHKELQIILVDDGSTDGCGEMLADYCARDRRMLLVALEKNAGYGHAVNTGMNLAQGEYVHIFEPDDVLHPQFYERLVDTALRSGADFVRCLYDVIDRGGEFIKHSRPYAKDAGTGWDVRKDAGIAFQRLNIWSLLVKRDFLTRHGIRMHESPGASFQDIGYYYQLIRASRNFAQLNEWLYSYREHGGQSIKSRSKGLAVFREYDFLFNKVVAELPRDERAWSLGLLQAMMVQKFVRHGLFCEEEKIVMYVEELLLKFKEMTVKEMLPFLSRDALSLALFCKLRNIEMRNWKTFVTKIKLSRLLLIGHFSRSERLIYRCLICPK